MYLKAMFHRVNYASHNNRMHTTRWDEYCKLDAGAQQSYLDIGTFSSVQTTMHAFFASISVRLSDRLTTPSQMLSLAM